MSKVPPPPIKKGNKGSAASGQGPKPPALKKFAKAPISEPAIE